jgi:large subunit ribosomal protein L24e
MVKCTYCGKNIEAGTGMMLVAKDGKVVNFCSKKCEKNRKLKRIPRKLKWISKGGKK